MKCEQTARKQPARCLMELPPRPDIKQSKNKSEPQALWLVDGIDISNLSMLQNGAYPACPGNCRLKQISSKTKETRAASAWTFMENRHKQIDYAVRMEPASFLHGTTA